MPTSSKYFGNISEIEKQPCIYILSRYFRKDIIDHRKDKDIPVNVVKENSDLFTSFTCASFNNMFDSSIFPAALKVAHITSFIIQYFCL